MLLSRALALVAGSSLSFSFTVSGAACIARASTSSSNVATTFVKTSLARALSLSTAIATAEVPSPSSTSETSIASSSASTLATDSTTTSGTKYMVVFGDSYSSTGFWITNGYPSSSEPMGNGGSTTSGGLNWAGMVTKTYNTSLVLTYDFAVYGATVDTSLVRGSTPDVKAQVGYFNEYLASKPEYAPWTSDDLLVAVWIGINDVGNSWWDGVASPIDSVMDEYFQLLQNLTDVGVTNFALLSVPPFNHAPTFVGQSQASLATLVSNITAYNDALKTRLDTFKTANTGIKAQIIETEAPFTTALNNPTSYGATDATCSNTDGTSCIWYDGYHAGQAIHKLVAQAFVSALKGSFF